jgi:hypothetical protein
MTYNISFKLGPVIPPTWVVTPAEAQRIVQIGESVVLRCEATGHAKIQWWHNGQLLGNNERIQITNEGMSFHA